MPLNDTVIMRQYGTGQWAEGGLGGKENVFETDQQIL